MNNSRRKIIASNLAELRQTKSILTVILSEESESLKRIPDDEENAERKVAVEELIGYIEEALESLENAIDILDGADL